jgi:ubiquinone/menaquinone biosynthesis C-methylase UbiE
LADDWPDIRHTYDIVAEDYAKSFADELAAKPFDRTLLDAFATAVSGPVLDIGCGPAGHVTRYLADRGMSIGGVDLSPRGVEVARATHPDLHFTVADMRFLPIADGSLAGIVAFYSVIHLARREIPTALTEFHRVLTPGGTLLIAMHAGSGETGADDWFSRDVSVRATLVELPELSRLLTAAGFIIAERHQRDPYLAEHPTRRLYVLARRPAGPTRALPRPS